MEKVRIDDLEEIDTIIAELEISKGKGNLILCMVNYPAYRDGIVETLTGRFSSTVIYVEDGKDIIQTLKSRDFFGVEILIWLLPPKATEDLINTLNNFRELFYSAEMPSIMFLNQVFLDDVIRNAPDFWRYRGNYHELRGVPREKDFEAVKALATPLHYQSEEDLMRRKRINEYLLKKITDKKEKVNIIGELGELTYYLGDLDNSAKYFENALKLNQELENKIGVASALNNLGVLAQGQGDYQKARKYYNESLEIANALGDKAGVSKSLHNLGMLVQDLGDYQEARKYYHESLEIANALGDNAGVSKSLHNLGALAQDQGDYQEARKYYHESLEIANALGDKAGVSKSLHQLGALAQDQGDFQEARKYYHESLEIKKAMGDKAGVSKSLHQLGALAQDQGDFQEARKYYHESLEIFKAMGDKAGIANSLAQSALLEEIEDNLRGALELIKQAEKLFVELESPRAIQAQRNRKRLEEKMQSA